MVAHFLKATAFFVKCAHLSKAIVLVFYAKCYLSHLLIFPRLVLVFYAKCYLSNLLIFPRLLSWYFMQNVICQISSFFQGYSLGILYKMLFVKFAHFSKAIVLVFYTKCYLSHLLTFPRL